MVLYSTDVKEIGMARGLKSTAREGGSAAGAVRERILEAAFTAFTKNGFAATSTAEIAASAHVSKREIYALVGNKQKMLAACISARAKRLQMPTNVPVPRNRETFAQVLTSFGAQLLREISDPTVIAVFRLAIAEAGHTRDVAQTLDSVGRAASRTALVHIMTQARDAGMIKGEPATCAEQFSGLLWGNLMVSLLLGVAKRPSAKDIATRAHDAAMAFLKIYPPAV